MFQRDDNVKLAVLEEKLSTMADVISKLDENIEQLSNLSVNVSKMLAVHEEKLEVAREVSVETSKDLEQLTERLEDRLDEMSTRLSVMERKVWMGMGAVVLVGVLLQAGFIWGPPTSANTQKSVIMEVFPTD